MGFLRWVGSASSRIEDTAIEKTNGKKHMDGLTLPDDRELEDILMDPDYDQGMLQDWFKTRYGDYWKVLWNRYLETGRISVWLR